MAEWLSGLPLNIEYTNSGIIALAEQWHETELTDAQAEKVVSQWFGFIASRLIRLWERCGIDPHNPA